jgi:hypothetical protein
MPAPPNKLLESEFTLSVGPIGSKSMIQTCRNCTAYSKARNNSRALAHLHECEQFKSKLQVANTDLNISQKRQRTLTLPSLSTTRKRKLDSMAAMAIYMGARPFQLFEEPYMKQFVLEVSDGVYVPPGRRLIGGDLLDQQYQELERKVEALIRTQDKLHFVLDESPNISSQRIVNISVVIPQYGSIFLANENIGNQSLNTLFFVNWFLRQTAPFDLSRVSSLTTDTCTTMRSTWTGLETVEQLSHALFIPCDSHGLQLLIKDLLELPQIASVIAKAQTIVQSFHRAKKQYAILRSKQEKPQALLLSVITRWGSQFLLISSVLRCRNALFAWLGDPRAQIGKKGENKLSSIITDQSFWSDLSIIEQIIRPIHEAQKMSESDSSTLSKVVPRWQKLGAELGRLSLIFPNLIGGFLDIGGPFFARLAKQTTDLHSAAFLLDPISLLKSTNQEEVNKALSFLLKRCKEEQRKELHKSFFEFRTRTGVYNSAYPSSMHYDNPIAYWKSYIFDEEQEVLAKLAVRIFEAIANSVASERAFSAMNLIHSKLRNKIGAEKAQKLIYIYMNQRVLDRNGSIFISDPFEKSDEQQIELEEMLLDLLDSSEKESEDEGIDSEEDN